MLQFIRDRAQGVLVWTIVGLIIITFALFGLSGYLDGSSKNNVAEVNGVEISNNEYRRAYQNYEDRLRQMLGENYRADLFSPELIKNEVINKLVMRELMTQYLENENFHVSQQRLFGELKSIEAFQDDSGKFDAERYRELIRRQGMSEAYFEKEVARDLSAKYLTSGVGLSEFVTAAETDYKLRLANQQREMGYLSIDRNQYMKSAVASAEEVKTYYDSHKQEFLTPEQVSVEYVELKLDEMAKRFDVTDQAVRTQYDSQRANYVQSPEQRQVRHILIQVNKKTSEGDAKKKIAEIRKEIAAGKSFASMAKKHSEDPGSAKKGGDLGFFGKGVMDKAFEESAFKLKKGELSQPVRSAFGYHLLKLEKIKASKVKPFKDVKKQIKRELQMQQAQEVFFKDADQLSNISYEQPDSLQPVVDQLGLTLRSSGLFGRKGGSGITANPKIVTAAFSQDVLTNGRNSEMLELSDSHLLVLRIKQHKPAAQKDLKSVNALIQSRLKSQIASKQIQEKTSKALERLQKGESPKKVAASIKGAKWQKVGLISRSSASDKSAASKKVANNIRRYTFTLAKPQTGKITWGTTTGGTGNGVVVGLYKVVQPGATKDKNKIAQEKQRIQQAQAGAMFEQFMQQIRKEASISINLPKDEQQ